MNLASAGGFVDTKSAKYQQEICFKKKEETKERQVGVISKGNKRDDIFPENLLVKLEFSKIYFGGHMSTGCLTVPWAPGLSSWGLLIFFD